MGVCAVNDETKMAAMNFVANSIIALVLCAIATVGIWEIVG